MSLEIGAGIAVSFFSNVYGGGPPAGTWINEVAAVWINESAEAWTES